MIAIFYNPNKDIYYAKVLKIVYLHSDYKVGYVNQYNHKIVFMFYIDGGKLVPCNGFWDYINNKPTLKKKLINKLIRFLERSVRNGR